MTPEYWYERIVQAKGDLHRMMFDGPRSEIEAIDRKQQIVLWNEIKENDTVLDAGCGYGRILGLMPSHWKGGYVGVDISHHFLRIAEALFPTRQFLRWDLRHLSELYKEKLFDVAIVSGLKGMITQHVGPIVWEDIYAQLQRAAKRVLLLPSGKLD